jgi:HD-GYP domain-containing protein (c-di-GMP phosphodiesterase class II)
VKRESYELIKGHAFALSVALDERHHPTFTHCRRVAGLCLELGQQCGLSRRELRLLRLAAAYHDVGKIGIPDSVLHKPARFNDDDWAHMRAHSEKGQRILLAAGLEDSVTIGLAVRHHHERYDGNGYPDGLAGEAIPVLARIVAIADAYDAMASRRTYGQQRSHSQILDVLREERGLQHDAYLTDLFLGLIDNSAFKAPN